MEELTIPPAWMAGVPLQWGHGDEAVEEVHLDSKYAAILDKLQWGHGDEAVEEAGAGGSGDVVVSGFNGATAMKPWKSESGRYQPRREAGFNGATAMKPWKRLDAQHIPDCRSPLQWGHGDEAVEESHPVTRAGSGTFRSMGPRR